MTNSTPDLKSEGVVKMEGGSRVPGFEGDGDGPRVHDQGVVREAEGGDGVVLEIAFHFGVVRREAAIGNQLPSLHLMGD